jgi:hypothetical protein
MQNRYEHTQVGYLIIITILSTIILIGVILALAGFNWIALAVLVLMAVTLVLFSSLTVIISDDILEVRFGPGLVRRRFNLADIESTRIVKNPWYYGWGLRGTRHGPLYNVSGFQAVEIKLRNGMQVRIGTDMPRELNETIEQNIR